MKRQLKQFQTAVTRLGDHVDRLSMPFDEGGPDTGVEDAPSSSTSELMTPRETIVEYLDATDDGRIKQQTLVDDLEWSESTVSRHLSELEADGTIERYQIGRENVVFLDGTEVDPFDTDVH